MCGFPLLTLNFFTLIFILSHSFVDSNWFLNYYKIMSHLSWLVEDPISGSFFSSCLLISHLSLIFYLNSALYFNLLQSPIGIVIKKLHGKLKKIWNKNTIIFFLLPMNVIKVPTLFWQKIPRTLMACLDVLYVLCILVVMFSVIKPKP